VTDELELSADELQVLAGARRGLEPDAQDAARVLHATRLAIGSVAVVASHDGDAAGMKAASSALVKKAAVWLAIAGTSAWLGYHAGFAAGEQRSHEQQAHTQPQVRAAPASTPTQRPVAPVSEPSPATIPAPIPVSDTKPRAKAISAPVAPAPALVSGNDKPNPSLDAEVKTLRLVERALRKREPQRALSLLAQLDRDVVDGQLLEERAAARAMARCEERAASTKPVEAEVMQRVLEFSQQYPASVYFARVRQTCLATIDRAAATDSAPR
jgi:hypothetical protein